MSESELEKFKSDLSDKLADNEVTLENFERGVQKIAERASALESEKLDSIIGDIDAIDVDKAIYALDTIKNGDFHEDKKAERIEQLENKIRELHIANIEKLMDGIENMSKEELLGVKSKVEEYKCPIELKTKYIVEIDASLSALAEKEVTDIIGNINNLSTKKSLDVIVRLRTMALDDAVKNKYLDMIESHIMELKNSEQRAYILFLKQKIDEFNVSTANFLVPTLSNLFYPKYDEACKNYISVGRYELPIFLHDNSGNNGFALTTEYFYFINKGVFNRIKIDDIVSFQAKKSLVSTSIVVTERNGNTNEISCAINKNTIDGTAKAMTALVNYIRDQRSAEKMKELLENAVKERTMEIPVQTVNETANEVSAPKNETADAEPSVEPTEKTEETAAAEEIAEEKAEEEPVSDEPVSEEPKPRFCDQCGARITSPNAKFCAECGNKLS